MTLGDGEYGKAGLLWLLHQPSRGDASMTLAHQLIAAKLNSANGAGSPTASSLIEKGDYLLSRYGDRLPFYSRPWKPGWAYMIITAMLLDQYNNSCSRYW